MERTKNNFLQELQIPQRKETPFAILTADWHLREDVPVCRVDDFDSVQWRKVRTIAALSEKLQIPVIHAGDLYDYWKPSPELLTKTIKHLPKRFWTIYGNHDLPQHNIDLAEKCGVRTLQECGRIEVLDTCHWKQKPTGCSYFGTFAKGVDRAVLVWHVMTYVKSPYPGCKDLKAPSILRKYKDYDLIVTGDNHSPFVVKEDGRLLVNPGSLMRQTADQKDFRPRVYLWYPLANEVEPVYLPIDEDAVSTTHITSVAEKDARLSAFVESINSDWQGDASAHFEKNLKLFFEKHETRQSIQQLIYKSLDEL